MGIRTGIVLAAGAMLLCVGCSGGGKVYYTTAVLSKVEESGAVLEVFTADEKGAQGEIKLPDIGSVFIDSARRNGEIVTFKVGYIKPSGGEKEVRMLKVRRGETGDVWFGDDVVGLRLIR